MKTGLSDLPDEVRELIEPHMAESAETLAAIGLAIAQRRNDAQTARASSGIETTWKECEEAYIGIDDANRAEFQDARWAKPMSMDGPVTTGKTPKQTEHKSTAFVRLTARYVDAGSAKLGEILLPADDKAFTFSETPVPELLKAKEDTSQVVHGDLGVPLTRPVQPGEPVPGATPAPTAAPTPAGAVLGPGAAAAPPGMPMGAQPPAAAPAMPAMLGAAPQPSAPPQVPLTVKDLAEENIEIARKSAKKAEQRIYDWMVECQHAAEMRKVIDDAARIGVGVLNGPIPAYKKHIAVLKAADGVTIGIEEQVKPVTRWRDPWNIFPDPACGENIHNGDFLLDRDFMSPRQVKELKKLPGYIASQIDAVLIEGPDGGKSDESSDLSAGGKPGAEKTKGRFTVWYYYGSLKRSEMGLIWAKAGKKERDIRNDLPADKAEVYAVVTLINERVVKATINPLDSGAFPYHSVPWQRRAGHWAGIGVGEQIRMPQKMINSATRAMLNNAGKSAGGQYVIDRGAIVPADGSWTITPDKIWYKTGEDGSDDVNKAFALHPVENVTDQLMKIINYALQLAEESTSIPLLTQGLSGETQPETLGGMNLQNNNANQLLRSIGYAFDDHITEPVVRQFYEWLLLDTDVPDDEKGEWVINAHGSVALVERAIQDQSIAQMGAMVVNPAYGVDPKKYFKMLCKTKKLNPADLQYTPEEQARIDAAPKPEAPQVTAARITADTSLKTAVMKQGVDQQSVQSEERIAAAAHALEGGRVEAENNRTVVDHIGRLHDLNTKRELAMLEYANRRQISLDDAKAELAKTAMTLDTQRELNATDNLVDLHKHSDRGVHPHNVMPPPGQTPGRAGSGRAFEQGPAS